MSIVNTVKRKPTQTTPAAFSELYDVLMEVIEPDLMQKNLPHLEQKYKGESAENKTKRMAHYKQCFVILDEVVSAIVFDRIDQVVTEPVAATDPFAIAA